MTNAEVIRDLRVYARTLGAGTARANTKNLIKSLQRYSLGTTLVAGGALNLNAGYPSVWATGVRTATLAAGQLTVT